VRRPSRLTLLAAAGLALFAVFFEIASARGWWPSLRAGALHDTDLWAGFLGCAAILVLLLARRAGPARPADPRVR